VRIVHVTNEPFGMQTANGVQHAVYCLARAQAQVGESVAVFSRDDHAVHIVSDGAEPRRRHRIRGERAARSVRERLLSRHFERPLADDILAWTPDIVHFHSVHSPQNVALASYLRRAGVPYCVTVHGGLFRSALRRRRLKKAAFNLLFERQYLNEARFIHALTAREGEALRQYGVKRPIVVVPNGLPPGTDVRPSRPDALYVHCPWLRDRQVFMFIGRMDAWQKGLDLLIDAFARAGLRDAALVLVGPDYRGSRRMLTTLADRLGISSDVAFIDAVFGEDRANMFAAADVFVHPSRWEGVSLSVLAAAAAGKPSVITREADPLGYLEREHAAILVDASVESITDGLRRATALGAEELERMGTRARDVAAAYPKWESIASRVIDAYRNSVE
jgi:glycosyltransferase involved in cell wall biosynthesis